MRSAIIARSASGLLVSMHGCGTTVGIGSEIYVFGTHGILRTGAWGRRLAVARIGSVFDPKAPDYEDGSLREVRLPPHRGVWQQFLAIRRGELENSSPPELGLRVARLYDGDPGIRRAGRRPRYVWKTVLRRSRAHEPRCASLSGTRIVMSRTPRTYVVRFTPRAYMGPSPTTWRRREGHTDPHRYPR